MLTNSSNTEGGGEEEKKRNTWETREIADEVLLIKSKIVKKISVLLLDEMRSDVYYNKGAS